MPDINDLPYILITQDRDYQGTYSLRSVKEITLVDLNEDVSTYFNTNAYALTEFLNSIGTQVQGLVTGSTSVPFTGGIDITPSSNIDALDITGTNMTTASAIDVDMVVVMYKNADAGTVKEEVDSAVDSFFDLTQWNMGQPLYVSALYDQIMSINGVKFVNIFSPADDVLPEKDIGEVTGLVTVAFNELITL